MFKKLVDWMPTCFLVSIAGFLLYGIFPTQPVAVIAVLCLVPLGVIMAGAFVYKVVELFGPH